MPKKRKNNIVPTRLTDNELEILDNCGYNTHEIMKMFFDKYTSTTPVGLAIKLELLEKKKVELLDKQIILDNKINDIKKQLSNYNKLDLITNTTIKLIEIAISKYLNKSIEHMNINEFLEDNKELVDVQSNKIGYTIKDYKKLVIEYYNKNYD
jgi:hypothetical protein